MRKKRIIIVGAGLAGLSAAPLLSRSGFAVTVIDRHNRPGGVAGRIEDSGFIFDTGPSWYLMAEAFDRYFALFGKKPADYYRLVPLDPSYRVFFEGQGTADIRRDQSSNEKLFASFEQNGAVKLHDYLAEAAWKYRSAVDEFLYSEYTSLFQFLNPALLRRLPRLNLLSNLERLVARTFSDHRARKILEFNTVFLGSSPKRTPALYSLMAHADITEGVSFPLGGIHEVVLALVRLGEEEGVTYRFGTEARKVIVEGGTARAIETTRGRMEADAVILAVDYHHAETDLLDECVRNYRTRYWETRTIAPATFLVLLGVRRRVPALAHHNFFLAYDWDRHFRSIFDDPSWPENPSYYVGVPSKTDPTLAPTGGETLFVLVPVACGLPDPPEQRERFAEKVIAHLESLTGFPLRTEASVKKILSHTEFARDHHYFKGTGLGLAHTLSQSALFRPSRRNRRVKNLYYAGHYTQPGIGMPMALIGSELVWKWILRDMGAAERAKGNNIC